MYLFVDDGGISSPPTFPSSLPMLAFICLTVFHPIVFPPSLFRHIVVVGPSLALLLLASAVLGPASGWEPGQAKPK
jgi:hypothetical protein